MIFTDSLPMDLVSSQEIVLTLASSVHPRLGEHSPLRPFVECQPLLRELVDLYLFPKRPLTLVAQHLQGDQLRVQVLHWERLEQLPTITHLDPVTSSYTVGYYEIHESKFLSGIRYTFPYDRPLMFQWELSSGQVSSHIIPRQMEVKTVQGTNWCVECRGGTHCLTRKDQSVKIQSSFDHQWLNGIEMNDSTVVMILCSDPVGTHESSHECWWINLETGQVQNWIFSCVMCYLLEGGQYVVMYTQDRWLGMNLDTKEVVWELDQVSKVIVVGSTQFLCYTRLYGILLVDLVGKTDTLIPEEYVSSRMRHPTIIRLGESWIDSYVGCHGVVAVIRDQGQLMWYDASSGQQLGQMSGFNHGERLSLCHEVI